MQLQTSTSTPGKRNTRSKPVKEAPSKEFAWNTFRGQLSRLIRADADPTVSFEVTLKQFLEVETAYRVLREAWTGPSKKGKRKGHDPALEAWLKGRDAFEDHFWGPKGPDGKRHGSADPEVRRVMEWYQHLWNKWRKKTPAYAEYKKGENKRRNKLAHVKAKKQAWAKSEAGQKWWASRNEANRAQRAALKIAELAFDATLTEVLADV